MLSCGRSIVIDRTNYNKDQRSHFLSLAKDRGLPVFGLVLDIPVAVSGCMSEALRLRSYYVICEFLLGAFLFSPPDLR